MQYTSNENKMTAIILAGGKNSRISQKKAFIKIDSKTIIENTIEILKNEFDEILIVSNEPEEYSHLNIKIVSDVIKGKGPLGGLHAGLLSSKTFYNFFIACDMPFINNSIIQTLKQNSENCDAVIPEHKGFLEPLCAIYSKNCVQPILKQINKNNLKIKSIYDDLKIKTVSWKEYNLFGENEVFFNINTKHDLVKAREYYSQIKNNELIA